MGKQGSFITFEGGEGCGKSYQSRILYNRLVELALPVILTHEPGGTHFGERITKLLKWDNKQKLAPLTEMLLFNASRVQLVGNVIKPALEEGKIVICDRFSDSTTVYQGYGRGLDKNLISLVNDVSTEFIKPDLKILLDIPTNIGLMRKAKQKPDRFHREKEVFHKKIRNGFLELANKEPDRWLIIDASLSRKIISGIIWENVMRLLVKRFIKI